jgi:hypothetical protein
VPLPLAIFFGVISVAGLAFVGLAIWYVANFNLTF